MPTGPEVARASRLQDLPDRWRWSPGGVFPAFCPLSCSAVVALLANMALFRILRGFLEGFYCWVWVCMLSGFAWLVGLLYA